MSAKQAIATIALLAGCTAASAQQTNQVQLKVEANNRTLTVSTEGRVSVDPDVAILHIGFQTQPSDAKGAYAAGAKLSNDIVSALKQAGIPETAIHSEWQRLESASGRQHKFTLQQQWTVKTVPLRAAEILDIAVGAGATDSGQIDWTVQDEQALREQALDRAATRAKAEAAVLAKSMGVHLGALIYVTNQISSPQFSTMSMSEKSIPESGFGAAPPMLSIEPRKVSSTASVYAVFCVE